MPRILAFRMPEDAMERLASEAKRDNRKTAGLARKIILDFLDAHTLSVQAPQAKQ